MNPARAAMAELATGRSVRARLARNTGWSVAGSVFSQGASLAAAVVLGRMLGVADFGQIALVQATVVLASTLGEMGMALTTTKFAARWRALEPARAGRLIGSTFRLAAFSATLLGALLFLFGKGAFRAACPLLIFDMLNRIQTAALAGLEGFESAARVNLARSVILLPLTAAGAALWGVPGALLGMGASSAGTFAFGQWTLHRKCASLGMGIDYRGRFERGVLTTSLSLWAAGLLLAGSNWAVTFLLSRPPGGLAQLGLFNGADKWRTALSFIPTMLFQVTLPMLSSSHAARDYRSCGRILASSIFSTLAVTGTGALAVAALSKPLMSSYGTGFEGGATVLAVFAVASVAGSLYTVGSGALWALGKPSTMLSIDVFKTILLIGLCGAGMAASARHAALAHLVSLSAGSAVLLWTVRRELAKAGG